MGLLTRGQERFAGQLSRETGLDPRVIGAWALAEQSGGAARGYEQRGYHNWLNIARTDSGDRGGAHAGVWRDPSSAARATAEWLRGRGPIAQSYGAPAGGIRRIPSSGRDPQAQINAIASSGWASSGYNGGSSLRSLFSELHGFQPPAGTGAGRSSVDSQATGASARGQLGVQQGDEGTSPDLIAALEQALRPAPPAPLAAGAVIPRPEHSAGPTLPAGARTPPPLTPAPEPDPAQKILPLLEQLTAGTSSKVTSEGGTPASSGPQQALTRAVPHGTKLAGFLPGGATLKVGRIDKGQDLQTDAGGPILAPGAGYVVDVKDNPGGFGTHYPIVHFTSGPLAGHDVYIGHTHSTLPKGAHFGAGATLSRTGHGTPAEGNARTPGWAEIGLWSGGPGPMGAGKQIRPLLGLR